MICGLRIVKSASLASLPVVHASCAVTRTRACVVGVFGTVHAKLPVFAIPVAITFGYVAPPSVEYARSTLVTATLSVAVQVIVCGDPISHVSPPFGLVTVTAGAWLSM